MQIEILICIIIVVLVIATICNKMTTYTGGGFLAKLVDKYAGEQFIKAGNDKDLLSLVDKRGNKSPKDFMFTPEGIYSISPPSRAREIAKIIAKYHDDPKSITITDATSCNGGDAIAFAKTFGHVNAVEINTDNFAALKNNIGLYKLPNVTLYNDDYTAIFGDLHQDVVHMDPPWGGLDYKAGEKLRLKLGDMPVADIVAKLAAGPSPPHISMKVPNNFDIDHIKSVVPTWKCDVYDLKKFLLIQLNK